MNHEKEKNNTSPFFKVYQIVIIGLLMAAFLVVAEVNFIVLNKTV